MQQGFNHYLWLNDDTALFPDALSNLLDASVRLGRENIVVGSTHDPETHQLTYGGVTRLHRSRRLHSVSYTHLRAHETVLDLVCRLLLNKKKHNEQSSALMT